MHTKRYSQKIGDTIVCAIRNVTNSSKLRYHICKMIDEDNEYNKKNYHYFKGGWFGFENNLVNI